MYAQRRADLFLQLQRTYGNTHARQVADLIKAQTRPPTIPAQRPPAVLQHSSAEPAQRSASPDGGEQRDVAGEIQSSKGSGQQLDSVARARLEPAMGVDLSNVTIHADSQADTLSRSVQADAFTTGNDVYFRAGRYDPHSDSGLHLLAHELTHTVQQSKGAVSGTQHAAGVSVSDPGDSFEREAEQNATQTMARISSGASAPASTSPVQRSPRVAQREKDAHEEEEETPHRPGASGAPGLLQRHATIDEIAPQGNPATPQGQRESGEEKKNDLHEQIKAVVPQHDQPDAGGESEEAPHEHDQPGGHVGSTGHEKEELQRQVSPGGRVRVHRQPAPAPVPAAPAASPITSLDVPLEIGVGRTIRAKTKLASGTPAATTLTWTAPGAPAGVTITPHGKREADIQAAPASLPGAGSSFTVQVVASSAPGSPTTSAAILLVGIAAVTFVATPAFTNIAALGGPFPFPPNTADPNRGGISGNTAVATIVTAPAGRATTVKLPKSLGASASGNVITPASATGNITVRVIDTATKSQREDPLTINPVPLRVNAFPGQTVAGTPYGVTNQIGWASSDATGVLNRIIGETIVGGGRDDFGLSATINGGGPNPGPQLSTSVPANAWFDQNTTPAVIASLDINRFVGPGSPKKLPGVWVLRQGFHFMGWTGNYGSEFDHGIHRRSLLQQGPNNFIFRTEQIFPGASAATFNEPYAGPPLIVLSNITLTPLAPAATALAADGVATANITVTSTVAGRQIAWNLLSGPAVLTTGATLPLATPAAVRAGTSAGTLKIKAADSVFPNRQVSGTARVAAVALRGISTPVKTVPAGVLTAAITLLADPGGRTINWVVDAAATAAGVTIVGVAPAGAAAPQRGALLTRSAGFTGKVTVTASDAVLAGKKAKIVITFK